ncbi:thiazole synthase [Synechococcus sp. RS9916]|nr:thiazole synthase [Synechococcus sp. RS9916]
MHYGNAPSWAHDLIGAAQLLTRPLTGELGEAF